MNRLTEIMLSTHVERELTTACASGEMDTILPELARLGSHDKRHKDMLAHSIRVAAKTPKRIEVRLAGLLHDIGKPDTRKFEGSKVTFWMHEDVGARIVTKRLPIVGYDRATTERVARMIRMSGDCKQAHLWSDAAVRRFVTDAGDCLDELRWLFRTDTTSKHAASRREIALKVDALRVRIAQVAELDRERAFRPVVTGRDVMARYSIEPGPEVGRMMALIKGATTVEEAWSILDG